MLFCGKWERRWRGVDKTIDNIDLRIYQRNLINGEG